MGTDNLHHKRKAKSKKALLRRRARRDPYKKILIVCEGQKTEPNYFENAREYYSLNTVNVEVRGDCGSDPLSIVKFAKQRFKEEKDAGDPFEEVYCVFDKDQHSTYVQALNNLKDAKPQNVFFAINSVPCFEYWLLLHFDYKSKPYNVLPGNSPANQVLTELHNYIPNYNKNSQTVFLDLIQHLERAINRAEKIWQQNIAINTDNPSTQVHKLIQILQKIKQ